MKDYSIGESKKNYILRIEEDSVNGTFNVVFADGSKFTDIDANEENIAKVIRIQDKQAKTGVANKAVFAGRKTKAGIMTVLSAAGTLGITTAVSNIPAISEMLASANPVTVYAGIGMITILGAIPACAKLFKESEKVAELERLEYLEKNKEKLANYRNYHNVLRGLNKRAYTHFRDNEDPYCILDIDEYEKEDLQIIMENIRKEEEFGFTYKKKPTGAAKK